ncbi:hypothetical protein GCM10010422_47930 [Streptomyces graminearus]|uniref:Uncharacterized protein n=1 Tax=Streptomyces graminearus TaxID=284030 RepID=A0ABN3M2W9_9ACTN
MTERRLAPARGRRLQRQTRPRGVDGRDRRLPRMRRYDGPRTVHCDRHAITPGRACGTASREHGLAFSEVWLLTPDG